MALLFIFWSYLLVAFLASATWASSPTTKPSASLVPGAKTSTSSITGLLAPASKLNARQQEICPFAGGTFCSGTDYCCPPGTFCQPLNPFPLACCITATAMSCNGGTACCDRATEQCCTAGCCLLDSNIPAPTLTTNFPLNPPSPTHSTATAPFPQGTIGLDYQDMLKPRANEPAALDRVGAVNSLFRNMCLGMQKAGTLSSQTATFTYAPSQQSSNRRATCGSVSCPSGQVCDEFPFAITTTGGSKNAAGGCVDILAISIQAAILGPFFNAADILAGDTFVLRLANVDCSALLQSEVNAQNNPPSGLTTKMQQIQLLEFSPFSDLDFYNHSVWYLGNLTAGQYTVNIQVIEGIVDGLQIVDYQGLSYASSGDNLLLGILDPPLSLSFTVPQDAIGITLVLDTLIDYKISASMIVGPGGSLPSSSSPSGSLDANPLFTTPTSTGSATGLPSGIQSSSAGNQKGGGLHSFFWCAVVGTLSMALDNA